MFICHNSEYSYHMTSKIRTHIKPLSFLENDQGPMEEGEDDGGQEVESATKGGKTDDDKVSSSSQHICGFDLHKL